MGFLPKTYPPKMTADQLGVEDTPSDFLIYSVAVGSIEFSLHSTSR